MYNKLKQLGKFKLTLICSLLSSLFVLLYGVSAFADNPVGLGVVAENISGSFKSIGKLIIGTAYLAGVGFCVAAIFKFKQHKDNPTQIPVGTPIALLVISISLVFLPFLFAPAGETIFGSSAVKNFGSGESGFSGGGVSVLPGE